MYRSCHSEPVLTLAWESVSPGTGERIAITSLRTGFAMTARERLPKLGLYASILRGLLFAPQHPQRALGQ